MLDLLRIAGSGWRSRQTCSVYKEGMNQAQNSSEYAIHFGQPQSSLGYVRSSP